MSKWRNTRAYRKWRALVIRRDVKCVVCGSMKRRSAHHKNHATYFLSQRFDLENGVCLCGQCHIQFHCNYKNSSREKCTKKDFNNFMDLCGYLKSINSK